ncbi:hypothetical protein [Haloferax gibbonsii]|uniref:hypothetical protein n=1 Tax=Haloferax gibbonsii TaxID=35746 RepID=UPI00126867D9|nr:hypothetical protein [Haloferax gibbonsii]
MATTESLDSNTDSRALSALSEYTPVLYFIGSVLGILFLGYAVDILAGPLNESTVLAHQISGLLAAVALVLAICGVLVAVLWAGLFISNR